MVSLIIGNKGSGKTKRLIDMVNDTTAKSNGNVVCIEKEMKLKYEVTHQCKLVDIEDYAISGFDALYGFIVGMCAGNYDITDIFVDATFRIAGRDYEQFADFIAKLAEFDKNISTNIIFTVSCDESELPARVFDSASKI